MKDRLVIFGFGLDFVCAAAMAKLRFPRAELMPVSTSFLPRFLEQQAVEPKHRNIIILGVGLNKDPARLATALLALRQGGVRVLWISVLSPPELPPTVLENLEIALGSGWLCDHVTQLLGNTRDNNAASRISRLLHLASTDRTAADLAWIELIEAAIAEFLRHRRTDLLIETVKALIRGSMGPALQKTQADYHEHGDRVIRGRSQEIHDLKETVRRVAESAIRYVLLESEPGTDVHLIARYLHDSSSVAKQPCHQHHASTLSTSEDLHAAFANAEAATLIIADVDELPPSVQGALLGLLELRTSHPARVVFTTHQDLHARVESGTFRADLYWRICGMRLTLAPLRQRLADVAVIVNDFALRSGRKRLTREQIRLLEAYEWPGNAAQLRGFLDRVFALGDVDWQAELAGEALRHPPPAEPARHRYLLVPCDGQRLEAIIAAHVQTALALHNGNKTKCAKTLSISVNTLKRHLAK